jgi:hypothetical protein
MTIVLEVGKQMALLRRSMVILSVNSRTAPPIRPDPSSCLVAYPKISGYLPEDSSNHKSASQASFKQNITLDIVFNC